MFAYIDDCWDSGRKQLIYNGTENSPARQSWHCPRKDTALSIPGTGFCNACIPWSPRLLHEQWDFKNPCSWWWVTQAHQELSEHQSCQLHTQSDNACEKGTAAEHPCVTTPGTSACSHRERAGASCTRGLPCPAGVPRLLQVPSTSALPSSSLYTVRFQHHLRFHKVQGSGKCFIMETWRQTYLLPLLHMPKTLFLCKKKLFCWLTYHDQVSLPSKIWCYWTCRNG